MELIINSNKTESQGLFIILPVKPISKWVGNLQGYKTFYPIMLFQIFIKIINYENVINSFLLSLAHVGRENIVLMSNFQNVDFDGFTSFEVS